ncbi:hypothetical protein SVAN01_03677 [Stagonosporopsis vannaccii]|nr:hypothetical protein SVAN01_03677 [Stagonosporopsis vannaccii]
MTFGALLNSLMVLFIMSAAVTINTSGKPASSSKEALSDGSFTNVSFLLKRWDGSPAMGEEISKAKSRGCTLWSMMHSNDAEAGQLFTPPRAVAHSDYLQLDDLRDWGYMTKTPTKNPKCDMGKGRDMLGLRTVLKAKGISANKKDWMCVLITHGDPDHKSINIDNQAYDNPRGQNVTGALFHFAINEKDGVLIIAKRYGVAYQSQYRRPPVDAAHFPDLRSSSDIAWLAWKPSHEKGIKLNHIFTWSITNGGTQRLIAAAFEASLVDKSLQNYPWVKWAADRYPGSLILGSPNGLGLGFLLAQHKPELGNKRIKKVEAFLADTATSSMHEPTLYWEIEDSPLIWDELVEF